MLETPLATGEPNILYWDILGQSLHHGALVNISVKFRVNVYFDYF